MKRALSLLTALMFAAGQAWAAGGSTFDGGLILAPTADQTNTSNAIQIKNAAGTSTYTVTFAGTPSTAVTVDGTANLTFNDNVTDSPALAFQDQTDATFTFLKSDNSWLTGTPSNANHGLNILTGNLKVGNGTPTQTLNGEDFYVEGIAEFDSAVSIDANLTVTPLAAGLLQVVTGNLAVGNGVPTVAQDGEDAYVEGGFEVDGAARFDGAITAISTITGQNTLALDDGVTDSPILRLQDATDETADIQKLDAGFVTITTVAGDGVSIRTGNFTVGNGVPTTAQDGEDAYVEGLFEVDGTARFDGALNANGAVTAASTVASTLTNAAGASANPFDYTATAGIMDGTDDLTIFDINLTNANHTGVTNTIYVMEIANITGDADATEDAIQIGTGWDLALDLASPVRSTYAAAADSAATNNAVSIAATTPVDTVGTNTHQFINVAPTIGNATGGTNTVNAINVAAITGDAQVTTRALNIGAMTGTAATEQAVVIGTGWDRGVSSSSPIVTSSVLAIGAQQTFTDSDATPDVSGGSHWITNTTAVTITDFDAGAGTLLDGQLLTVESAGVITFDVTASGIVGGTTDIVTAAGDQITFVYDGTDWKVISFMDLSDNLN